MKLFKKMLTSLLCFIGLASCQNANSFEASMNFDLENVKPFLEQLNSNLNLGLEVDALYTFAAETSVESERHLSIKVNFKENQIPLKFQVFMDDVEAPDIYFFTNSENLAKAIENEFNIFTEKLGI